MTLLHLRRGEDLTGLTFGALTVVRRMLRPGHHAVYLCTCACGIETDARADNLRSGRTTSCGCRRTVALVERSTKREPTPVAVPPPPPSETRVRLPVVSSAPALTRGECAEWERPCVLTSCRYHLEHGGESCALDVADRGAHTGAEIAPMLGVSRSRVHQIERDALRHVSRYARPLRGLLDRGGRAAPLRERVIALLAEDPRTLADLCEAAGASGAKIKSVLRTLREVGVVCSPDEKGGTWRLADEEGS